MHVCSAGSEPWMNSAQSRDARACCAQLASIPPETPWKKRTRDATMPRSEFRPCIDLHGGVVKQIVGGTLRTEESALRTNFVSQRPPAYYAQLYKDHGLRGGHVIKLGPGNDDAAAEAVGAWPDGMHVGGGINEDNAAAWIARGAEKVIVTSYLFPDCRFSLERLRALEAAVGKERLVVDISCRRTGDSWTVAMNRWQDLTDMQVTKGASLLTESLDLVSAHCSELLIHAADVEGLCKGIDEDLARGVWAADSSWRVGNYSGYVCWRSATYVPADRHGRYAPCRPRVRWPRQYHLWLSAGYLWRHRRHPGRARAVEQGHVDFSYMHGPQEIAAHHVHLHILPPWTATTRPALQLACRLSTCSSSRASS